MRESLTRQREQSTPYNPALLSESLPSVCFIEPDAPVKPKSPGLTWGIENKMLMVHATVSITLFLLRAMLMARGSRIADCLSKLITTVTKAHEYMAWSLRNIRNLQARSPASHWTVMFHTASTGITMKVTKRSAAVRLIISTRTWDLRLWPLAAHSTARLQRVEMPHRVKVMITLTLAAVEKVGSCGAPSADVQLQWGAGQSQLALRSNPELCWYMLTGGSQQEEAFIFWPSPRSQHCSATWRLVVPKVDEAKNIHKPYECSCCKICNICTDLHKRKQWVMSLTETEQPAVEDTSLWCSVMWRGTMITSNKPHYGRRSPENRETPDNSHGTCTLMTAFSHLMEQDGNALNRLSSSFSSVVRLILTDWGYLLNVKIKLTVGTERFHLDERTYNKLIVRNFNKWLEKTLTLTYSHIGFLMYF